MNNKKYIGKFIKVNFADKKDTFSGIVIDSNEEWTLLKKNPVDYVIDGNIIFKHTNIRSIDSGKEERWFERVIKLKKIKFSKKELIPLTDISTILKYLTKHFEVFQLETKKDKACYLGKIREIINDELYIDNLDPKGKWSGYVKFKLWEIRIIEFDTDYINSLKLVSKIKK